MDFSQLRVTMLADTLRDLVEQIKFTNTHVARLTRDIGELRSDLMRDIADLRSKVDERFDRMQRDVVELRGEQALMANQILGAQQDARRALARIEDLLEERSGQAEE